MPSHLKTPFTTCFAVSPHGIFVSSVTIRGMEAVGTPLKRLATSLLTWRSCFSATRKI